ncbi:MULTISPECIES: DUF4236 domain-containing protein [Paraburkholderia]|uniref:DUF4236 domain-containing protein n=1 Tax=Paraburkholderia TaxID=1822464 RepID=UPI0038BC4144
MGLSYRKSLSTGPFRFNLSGAGIGVSVGVPGFRIGTGPWGNYVLISKGGFTYRAILPSSPANRTRSNGPCPNGVSPPTLNPPPNSTVGPMVSVSSVTADQLALSLSSS